MGSLERRLQALESRVPLAEDLQAVLNREFWRRLTNEEAAPIHDVYDQAADLVPCPRFEPRQCDCRCAAKTRRGFSEHPELKEELQRRWQSLVARQEEILARDAEEVEEANRRNWRFWYDRKGPHTEGAER